MGRTIPSGLQPLLDLVGCETHTTLSLIPTSGLPLHFATAKFTAEGDNYTSNLVRTDEIRQSVFSATDRVNATVQNVDEVIGAKVDDESLIRAEAIVGRFYRDQADLSQNKWVELFRGQAVPTEVTEPEAVFEILNDLAAAGYCVANWTLAENCQFVFKHLGTCGYVGALATCNKRRRSNHGCEGRANEHRFGGMEYPEPQTPVPPTGGGGGEPGDWPGGPIPCPRLDQYVRVRGRHGLPVAKLVEAVTNEDLLFHPVWRTFHKIRSARVVRDQPIWELRTTNGAGGFSSFSHPIIRYQTDTKGIPVSRLGIGERVLTAWPDHLQERYAAVSRDTRNTGDVLKIELEDGHIYCYSDTTDGPYIVCHNAKPLETY